MLQMRLFFLVAIATLFSAFSAQSFTVDFVAAASGSEGAGIPSMTFLNAGGSGITITATARDLSDSVGASLPTAPYPYLDDLFNGNPGGLGVCQTASCAGSSDDNIGWAGIGEVVILEFDSAVTVQSIALSNGVHLQNFSGSIGINLGASNPTIAGAFSHIFAASGALAPNLTGTRLSFVAPGSFTMTDADNQQIYINSITFVPEPGTALLFGLGLAGLASRGRRRE